VTCETQWHGREACVGNFVVQPHAPSSDSATRLARASWPLEIHEAATMKTQIQQRTDERDNRRVWRWVVIAVVVLLVGALTYNFLGRERTGAPTTQPSTQAPQNSAAPGK
jgi:anti-sigma-K factor RskA